MTIFMSVIIYNSTRHILLLQLYQRHMYTNFDTFNISFPVSLEPPFKIDIKLSNMSDVTFLTDVIGFGTAWFSK